MYAVLRKHCRPNRDHPHAGLWAQSLVTAMASLADVFVPVFEVRLEVGHEFAGVGAVDDAVVEA